MIIVIRKIERHTSWWLTHCQFLLNRTEEICGTLNFKLSLILTVWARTTQTITFQVQIRRTIYLFHSIIVGLWLLFKFGRLLNDFTFGQVDLLFFFFFDYNVFFRLCKIIDYSHSTVIFSFVSCLSNFFVLRAVAYMSSALSSQTWHVTSGMHFMRINTVLSF